MEIFAYGEDALTLWAIKNKLSIILQTLQDLSIPSKCQAFFRPSFGRRGGDNKAQFGEFDFMILSEGCLYLGESKWDKSPEKIQEGILGLRIEQIIRHELFKFYVEEWAFGNYSSWRDFETVAKSNLHLKSIRKSIAPTHSLLAANLQTVLEVIRKHYPALPDIRNVLLYLHNGVITSQLPQKAGKDFEVVAIDYSEISFNHFIRLDI